MQQKKKSLTKVKQQGDMLPLRCGTREVTARDKKEK